MGLGWRGGGQNCFPAGTQTSLFYKNNMVNARDLRVAHDSRKSGTSRESRESRESYESTDALTGEEPKTSLGPPSSWLPSIIGRMMPSRGSAQVRSMPLSKSEDDESEALSEVSGDPRLEESTPRVAADSSMSRGCVCLVAVTTVAVIAGACVGIVTLAPTWRWRPSPRESTSSSSLLPMGGSPPPPRSIVIAAPTTPPKMHAHDLAVELNGRFADGGRPDDGLSGAGVLLAQFDLQGDDTRPWRYTSDSSYADRADRRSAQLIHARMLPPLATAAAKIPLYNDAFAADSTGHAFFAPGFVLADAPFEAQPPGSSAILCAFNGEGWTYMRTCRPLGASGVCVPGCPRRKECSYCTDKTAAGSPCGVRSGCAYRPNELESMFASASVGSCAPAVSNRLKPHMDPRTATPLALYLYLQQYAPVWARAQITRLCSTRLDGTRCCLRPFKPSSTCAPIAVRRRSCARRAPGSSTSSLRASLPPTTCRCSSSIRTTFVVPFAWRPRLVQTEIVPRPAPRMHQRRRHHSLRRWRVQGANSRG